MFFLEKLSILAGKLFLLLSKLFGLGAGGTWPGEIALNIWPSMLSSFSHQFRKGIIVIAGTNGKTTTALMITKILEKNGDSFIHNASGANLLNGIASAIIQKSTLLGKIDADWGIFEVDENSLPLVISSFALAHYSKKKKLIFVLLNLFRDQLDRYGEVDVIAEKWQKSLSTISDAHYVLNCDDPLITYIGKESIKKSSGSMLHFFGIEDSKEYLKIKEHATDSTYCLRCGRKLNYKGIYLSHLGIWNCPSCGEARPKPEIFQGESPLPGQYNLYNTFAATGVAAILEISETVIANSLKEFKPAFGRQESFLLKGKKIKLFLSKNPTGFNASLRTVLELNPKVILLVLNDRIPDGRDISWIWDVDFETIPENVQVLISGDRVYDLGLRIKYTDKKNFVVEANLEKAITQGTDSIGENETLYVLATYSAMLETRKILTGSKI